MIHVNRRLIHQINQCARLITKKANERLEPFGLYSSQWSILYCLKTIRPMTQKEIWSLSERRGADRYQNDQTP